MAELYGCSKSTILKHAQEINFDIVSVQTPKLSKEDKKRIISLYNEKTSTELAKEYNVSRGMITKVWYDANLKGKEVTHSPKYNLTNQRFTNLIALYPTEERDTSGNIKWMCLCDCGNKKTVSANNLITGKIKSCGCLSKKCLDLGRTAEDLTNQKFGKLTVLTRSENKIFQSGTSVSQWLCQCKCGRYTKVITSNLKSGNTQSCGLCSQRSHGNIKIDKILTNAKILFEREKRFDSCKDKFTLPFDFYVDNRYLIEYDGNYHFFNDKTETLFNIEAVQKHDAIKTNWCLKNNIPLIRIPYTRYNDLCLEDLLLETSNYIIK